eukprot:486898-Alexandrium_andersonii.AAC.1
MSSDGAPVFSAPSHRARGTESAGERPWQPPSCQRQALPGHGQRPGNPAGEADQPWGIASGWLAGQQCPWWAGSPRPWQPWLCPSHPRPPKWQRCQPYVCAVAQRGWLWWGGLSDQPWHQPRAYPTCAAMP